MKKKFYDIDPDGAVGLQDGQDEEEGGWGRLLLDGGNQKRVDSFGGKKTGHYI